ncbi:MAG: putative metalloprotease CJM1_0395 family protein [Natronospirillum sp.]
MTSVSLNAVFPSGLLDRGQQSLASQTPRENTLFVPVTETAAVERTEYRLEMDPEERRQDNQRGKPLALSAEQSREPDTAEKELRTREQLEAAQRSGRLNAEQDAKLADIQRLAERDREVRVHEQSHKAVAGRYAGPVNYDYVRGPDGRRYAVSGQVPIDLSPGVTPEQTIAKMEQVRRAALAPADPSAADRSVASEATQLILDARSEALRQQRLARAEEGEARESARSEELSHRAAEKAEQDERAAERKANVEEDATLDERLQAVNTDSEVRLSRIQAAIAELLRNQGATLDNVTLGKNVNFQI